MGELFKEYGIVICEKHKVAHKGECPSCFYENKMVEALAGSIKKDKLINQLFVYSIVATICFVLVAVRL